jgi:hypothetical protein
VAEALRELGRRLDRRLRVGEVGEVAVSRDEHIDLCRAREREKVVVVGIARRNRRRSLWVRRPLRDREQPREKAICRLFPSASLNAGRASTSSSSSKSAIETTGCQRPSIAASSSRPQSPFGVRAAETRTFTSATARGALVTRRRDLGSWRHARA